MHVQCSPTSVGLTQAHLNYFSIFYLHTGAIPVFIAYFSQGIGIVHLTSVQCTGTEVQLLSCSHHTPSQYSYYCRHDDAGVICQGMYVLMLCKVSQYRCMIGIIYFSDFFLHKARRTLLKVSSTSSTI